VFQGPRRVDTSQTVRKPTPETWRKTVKEKEVSVIPLVKDPNATYQPGWISYRTSLLDSPETEIICGALNDKDYEGAAIWRQGHLLHFAFDLSPADMNQTGQALLLNSLAYIARFKQDRPIAHIGSIWTKENTCSRRKEWIESLYASGRPADRDLEFYFTPETKAEVTKMDGDSYPKWFRENSPFVTCAGTGKLMVDETAKELNLQFEEAGFFTNALEKLSQPATAAKARSVLKRYAPDGPGDASLEQWRSWVQANRPYLFYSQRAGYRWYVDPLARERGVPSQKLQGPARGGPG
jgi:hypothetical protein